MALTVSSFFREYINHPMSLHLSKGDRIRATIASVVIGILTLGIAHVMCSALHFRQITHLKHAQRERGIALARLVGPVSGSELKMSSSSYDCGQLSFRTFGKALQVSLIDPFYARPLPDPSLVLVPLADGRKVRWRSLTQREKIDIYNQKASLDSKVEPTSWGTSHIDDLLMLGGQAPYLPTDPRELYGSDHAVRMAIFVPVFAYLYAKYHPSVKSLAQNDVILAQFLAAGLESGRQTEGGDLYMEDSARRTSHALLSLEVNDSVIHQFVHTVMLGKDAPPTQEKPLIAKLIQGAKSVEAARFGPLRPPLDMISFHGAERFLDIFQELSTIAAANKGMLKQGLSFDAFENELDVIRWEMDGLLKRTHEKTFRMQASASGSDYYTFVLAAITPREYPLLHAILVSMGVKDVCQTDYKQKRKSESSAIVADVSKWIAQGLSSVPTPSLNRFAESLALVPSTRESQKALFEVTREVELRNRAQEEFESLLELPRQENVEKVVQAFASLPYLLRDEYRETLQEYYMYLPQLMKIEELSSIMVLEMAYRELCAFLDASDARPPLMQAHELMLWAKHLLELHEKMTHQHRDPRIQTACAMALERASILYHDCEELDLAKEALLMATGKLSCEAPHPLLNLWETDSPLSEEGRVFLLPTDCDRVRKRRLRVCEKITDEMPYREISFELTTSAREDLEKTLSCIDPSKKSTVPALYERKAKGENAYTTTDALTMGMDRKIEVGDGIEIYVGCDQQYWNQYHLVRVRVKKGVPLIEVQRGLAAIGLPSVLMNSRPQDIRNEALARILSFRFPSLLPSGAMLTQANHVYDSLSAEDKAIVDEDLRHMKEMFVSPDSRELVRVGLAQEAWKEGARALGTFIAAPNIKTTAQVVVNILRHGLLSSEERFQRGILGLGCVPKLNYEAGSGNQVFTRILTKDQFDSRYAFSHFPVRGAVFFLLDLRAMERMPYSYLHDRAGVRNPHYIKKLFQAQKQRTILHFQGERIVLEKPGFPKIIDEQVGKPHPLNETMFDQALGSQYIRGMVVETADDRNEIIAALKNEGIFDINGVALENAILVSSCLRPEMIPHLEDDQPFPMESQHACKYA